MLLLKPTAVFFTFFICLGAYAQMDFPEFGKFTAEEISLKQCSFDPDANAVILLDKGVSIYDDENRLITRRRIRIKILNTKGFDKANIEILFYAKENFESVRDIKAITYNFGADGRVSEVVVEKKSIFNEKKDDRWSLIKFAMPSITEGSIIEYEYEIMTKDFSMPDDWIFQDDEIPTLKSSYLVEVPPSAEITYKFQRNKTIQLNIKPIPGDGKIYFEMINIPALRYEPYMDAARDYVQKVFFQLSGVLNHAGDKQNVNTTWGSLAYNLMTEKYFGSQLDKNLKAEELKKLLQSESSEAGKLKLIYNYLKNNIELSSSTHIYAPDGISAVLDRKKGSASEMNLLLVNLLQDSKIEAYPLLAAEKDFGKVDSSYPYKDQFNKTVALAIADGKQYILDASLKNCPVGLTPYPLLGTMAFLVDKKKFNLVRIASGNRSYKNIISVNGMLDTKGVLTAEAKVKSFDYARQLRLDAIKNDRQKFINEYFEKPYEGLIIDSFLVKPPEYDSIPFEQSVRFKQQLNESGGFIFLNANLFTGLEKNPFSSSVRFTNVNFGFPYNVIVEEKIKLPEGVKVDLPEDKILVSDDNKIQAVRQVSFEGGELKVLIRFVQTTTLVTADAYNAMKGFYKNMTDMLNEPIVLKLPN